MSGLMMQAQLLPTLFPPSTFPPSVLVVNDPTDTCNLLCEAISAAGYIVTPVKNANETLKHMKIIVPDIVLLDTTSPLIKGFELGRQIKSTSAWAKIPILFMIEQANSSQIINSFESGGIDYISKPLRIPEVLARLLTHVDTNIPNKQPNIQNKQPNIWSKHLQYHTELLTQCVDA